MCFKIVFWLPSETKNVLVFTINFVYKNSFWYRILRRYVYCVPVVNSICFFGTLFDTFFNFPSSFLKSDKKKKKKT